MVSGINLQEYSLKIREGDPPSLNLERLREDLRTKERRESYKWVFSVLSSGVLNKFHNKEEAFLELKGRMIEMAKLAPEEVIESMEAFDLNDNNLRHIRDIATKVLNDNKAKSNEQRPSFLAILRNRTLATFDPTKMTQGAACAIFIAAQLFREARETDSLSDDFYMPAIGLSLGFIGVTAVNAVTAAVQNNNAGRTTTR